MKTLDPNLRFDEKALAAKAADAKKKPPSRRAFLGGAAVTIGLPFLESLVRTKEALAAGKMRFVGWHIPNGIYRPSWFPTTEGDAYTLSPSLSPLEKVKKKTLVFSGIQNSDASQLAGAHGAGVAGMLTCIKGTMAPTISVGISIDQVFANSIKGQTRIPSLQTGITNRMYNDLGFPAIYNGCISWASATQPLQPVIQPALIFDKIFEGASPAANMADQQRRKALQASVLDHVVQEAKRLETRLGTTDRAKLGEYLQSVRAVETQVASTTTQSCGSGGMRPAATAPTDGPTLTKLHVDLLVTALQCDATRVATFMLGNGGNSCFTSFPWLGITGDHHGIAHSSNGTSLSKIDKWEIEQLAYFCEKLDAIDDGGGATMLDNSVVFLSSEIDVGNGHTQINKGIVVVGGAGGKLKTGRHVKYPNAPQANLFVTLLNAMGVPATTFGKVGNQQLPGLI